MYPLIGECLLIISFHTSQLVFSVVFRKMTQPDGMTRMTGFLLVMSTALMSLAFNLVLKMPGGFSLETCSPKYGDTRAYYVYIKSTIYAFESSMTALITFFLSMCFPSLGKLLMLAFGLMALFISIPSVMVSFCCAVYITHCTGLDWIPSIVAMLPFLPTLVATAFVFTRLKCSRSDILYSINYCKNIFKELRLSLKSSHNEFLADKYNSN